MGQVPVPVVDIFAGPGGLGEGFASAHQLSEEEPGPLFNLALSVEKNDYAYQTLLLRHFYREFLPGTAPAEYYQILQGETGIAEVFQQYQTEAGLARSRVLQRELGKSNSVHREISSRITDLTGEHSAWVLVGGPPCQAYSVAGRARNKGIEGYEPENDTRHFLYEEFLRVLAEHWPPVFVLENVKGLLSATVNNQKIFSKMLRDLQDPASALGRDHGPQKHRYRVCSFINRGSGQSDLLPDTDLSGAIVRMERYGIPQARHRVLLLGIREEFADVSPKNLAAESEPAPVRKVLCGLPTVRSGLSRLDDTGDNWRDQLLSIRQKPWFGPSALGSQEIYTRTVEALEELEIPEDQRGGEFIDCDVGVEYRQGWYLDENIGGVCNHTARAHMVSDLHRYLFAACYAELKGTSPFLSDFPQPLLPNHKSVDKAIKERWHFSDRFRVQVSTDPATTVTSHISKDGHYFIHPNPNQCRSFTVREAARVQTFPDNYFFAGPRTAQYVQVGNAVPPLLSAKIARIVFDVLSQAGLT